MAQNDPSNSPETTATADAHSTRDEFAPNRSFCSFESFDYDAEESTFRILSDPDDVAPSTAVISALAAISDTDPLEIEPLYTGIDPDALDSLVSKKPATGDVEIAFHLHGHSVRVKSSGSIEITAS